MLSCLDKIQGLHQIPLTYESFRLTCLVILFEMSGCLKCPADICNAPKINCFIIVEMVKRYSLCRGIN